MSESNTELSLIDAKRLSILKWEAHVQAGGYCQPENLPKEIQKLKSKCGFCHRWRLMETYAFSGCCMCEFAEIAGRCASGNSLWEEWCLRSTKENAESILLAIKTIQIK